MYIIYGAGTEGKKVWKKLQKKGITDVKFADSNPDLWGKKIEEIDVLNPESILYDNIDMIIISMGYQDYCDVRLFLQKRCDEQKIIFCHEAVIISENDRINLGNIGLSSEKLEAGVYSGYQIVEKFDIASFNEIDKFIYQEKHQLIHKFIHYSEAYDRFFSKFKNKNVTVIEIGVYKGGSLQLWKNYFGSNAKIIGVDIDQNCKDLEEENISIYIGDQGDRNFLRKLKKEIGQVDIIIDDGGHFMNQQIVTFDELFDILTVNGVYLCEDCQTSYLSEYDGGIGKANTFIEFTKKKIDDMHANYIDSQYVKAKYADEIKSISYFENMVFIEKRNRANINLHIKI